MMHVFMDIVFVFISIAPVLSTLIKGRQYPRIKLSDLEGITT